MIIRCKVNAEQLRRILLNRERLRRAADKLNAILRGHILDGVDCNGVPLAPLDYARVDGSTDHPLFHTGSHLFRSIKPFTEKSAFGSRTNFIGARLHQKGTSGKGGSLPPIRPKNSRYLKIPVHAGFFNGKPIKDHIYTEEVNIRPRPFFKISDSEIRQVLREYTRK